MTQFDWKAKFPRMTPAKAPPALMRLNGCGVGIYGKRDLDAETGTHVTTWCISLLFVPVIALRAYRVKRASGNSWYFLGREPLSAFAKWWNISIIAGCLATAGVVAFENYINTPEYRARQQMSAAADQTAHGQLAAAAKSYGALASQHTPQAANAVAAAEDLLRNKLDAVSLSEAAGVITEAAKLNHLGFAIPPQEIVDKAMQIVAAKGDADPAAAVALLDGIRSLQSDTRAVDDRRLLLLTQWAAREPQNLDVVAPLALLLSEKEDFAGARKLLMPLKENLGDGEGARVLGMILAREGDLDGSYKLLWPYVKKRLDLLHEAEQDFGVTTKNLGDRAVQKLRNHQGLDEFYTRHDAAATEQEKQQLVDDYISSQMKDDPEYARSQGELVKAAGVVPTAMELGIVMLNQAQGKPDLQQRNAELKSAQDVFLAIGGVASDSDTYRLSLGKVDYWLGKQTDGQKLFDEYLNGYTRSFKSVMELAQVYRELGADGQARTMSEEAYAKGANSQEHFSAAQFRSACFKDLDDKIEWLGKSDPADAETKASLGQSRGEKAMLDGDEAEATRQFQAAVDTYAAMPRSAATLNNAAISYGDRASLDRCIDYFQQAIDLNPSNTILIFNAVGTLLDGAAADVIGGTIDFRSLHAPANISALNYLYSDQAGRKDLIAKFKSHPGVVRAAAYLQKLMVIAPKSAQSYAAAYGLYAFTRDDAALATLEEHLKAAGIDTSEQLADAKTALTREKDEKNLKILTASLAKQNATLGLVRSRNDLTAAVATDSVVAGMLALDGLNGSQDADKIVALAQDARRISPCTQADGVLRAALLNRAVKHLRKSDTSFDAFAGKFSRQLGATYLIMLAAVENSPYQQAALSDPDVVAAMQMTTEGMARFPDSCTSFDWAILNAAHRPEAEKAADVLKRASRFRIEDSIELMLDPCSVASALEWNWLMQATGQPDAARVPLAKIAQMGLPVPIQP